MPLQGGDPVRLTSKRGEWFPIVSPDGKWVYFSADEEGLTRATKMPAEGGTTVALTPPEVRFTAGAVSADGTTLYGTAWNAAGRRTQFAAVPTAGGAVAFLDSPRGARGLTPDEKSWVLIDVIGGVPGVYVVPRAGGKERLLVDLGQDQAWRGAISPDGKNAAVVRGRSTNDVILIKAK
jgi:Tol biopolymer transport system component